MKKNTYHLVSLGCAKNTVDSNTMGQMLEGRGMEGVISPEEAEVILVNTCGFIGPAREESYRVLLDLAAGKNPGQLLVAAGCLTQRYGQEVLKRVPGIDGILGTRRWMDILKVITDLRDGAFPRPYYHLPDVPTVGNSPSATVGAHIEGGSAYLKIADGCRRPCAFCAIPIIKGTAVSRPLEEIVADAFYLQETGVW
jgi:ribosomal protein S12 methylthiotransferase